jgi:hypothetical protein
MVLLFQIAGRGQLFLRFYGCRSFIEKYSYNGRTGQRFWTEFYDLPGEIYSEIKAFLSVGSILLK